MTQLNPAEAFSFGRSVNFGLTATDYRRYRLGFPPVLFERLAAFNIGQPGQKILDVGTGTGAVARGLAMRGAHVIGLDPAEALLDEARAIDRQMELQIEYVVGRVEDLDFSDGSFDVVTAGQCWHWFDRAVAARKVRRVLKPGGKIVIAHFDWIPLPGNVVAATEELILAHNPKWALAGATGLYPQWLTDLGIAQFVDLQTFSLDMDVTFTHEAWRGRIRASAGVRASLNETEVAVFDSDLAALLAERFPQDPLHITHRLWAVVGTALP